MKKLVVLFITFILFTFDAKAFTTINNMDINVYINEEGIAQVEETWKLPEQKASIIKKNFYNVNSASISDLSITDSNNNTYVQNLKINNIYNYDFDKKGKDYYLKINGDGTESVITIKYQVNGMIKSYNDAIGINWYFLNTLSDMEVKSLNISISSYTPYRDANVGLYGMGNNIECQIKDDKIIITGSYSRRNNKVYLLTTFSDVEYTNKIAIKDSFEHYYKNNKLSLINDIRNFVASETVFIILIVVIIITMIAIVNKIIGKNKNSIFSLIKVKSKVEPVVSIKDAENYDEIPCNTDFYRLEFLAHMFRITKNRSNIISATILKWILEGYGSIDIEKKTITIDKNLRFENPLDQELYDIIKDACLDLVIKNNNMSNYFKNNHKVIDEWFKHIYAHAIKCEYNENHIKIKKKKLIANSEVVENANKIMGLKKYLLNFNHVPRKSQLTISLYKNLLIASCLLGVSDSFSKEILRKNKDNDLAKLLSDFESSRDVLVSFYEIKSNTFSHFKDFNPVNTSK